MNTETLTQEDDDLTVDLSDASLSTTPIATGKMDKETVEILIEDRIATGG